MLLGEITNKLKNIQKNSLEHGLIEKANEELDELIKQLNIEGLDNRHSPKYKW